MTARNELGARRFVAYLVESTLEESLRKICAWHGTTLRAIYGDERGPRTHAARLHCWWVLFIAGKSPGEIARLFDRDTGAVNHGLKRLRDAANRCKTSLTLVSVTNVAMLVTSENASAQARNAARAREAKRLKARPC